MTTPVPQQRLAQAFVELAGSVVNAPTDPSGLLATLASQCTQLLDDCASTVLYLSDECSAAQLSGTDDELVRLERDAVEWGEGPGHDARSTGRPISADPLDGDRVRQAWPRYTPRALALGYRRAAALPIAGGDGDSGVSGVLILLGSGDIPLSAEALALGRSLADAAGFALAREREVHASRALADQLGQALTSRVVIEQAKGVIAAGLSVSVDEAFARLRGHARSRQRRLPDVARDVVDGRLRLGREDH